METYRVSLYYGPEYNQRIMLGSFPDSTVSHNDESIWVYKNEGGKRVLVLVAPMRYTVVERI